MPPRIPLRPIAGSLRPAAIPPSRSRLPASRVCLYCSSNSPSRTTRRLPFRSRNSAHPSHRHQSTTPIPTSTSTSASNPRDELIETLLELQKEAPNHVNLSRLQLALQGLRQAPGEESIRVAILGLSDGAESGKTVKDVLRLLLADPLSAETEWEKQLEGHDPKQPLIVRIRHKNQGGDQPSTLTISKASLLHELEISCPGLNDLNLELLLTEISPLNGGAPGEKVVDDLQETALVPAVDIPSNTGRFTPVTTPVHKAILVTEGIMGAASVVSLPLIENQDAILAVVDLPGYAPQQTSDATFRPVDVDAATEGLNLFRASLGNAMEYEKLWNGSNLPAVSAWLKKGIKVDESETTKPALRHLIASLLQNTSAAIQNEEAHLLGQSLSATATSPARTSLSPVVAAWSQSAHEELQEQLDLAFSGRRWRKLGWWKLFWRVDDVGMLTSDILSQRFLPGAERELVYLTGRIRESGAAGTDKVPVYTQPVHESELEHLENGKASTQTQTQKGASTTTESKWPTHIAFTRRYLHAETVPALQALAQKLVLEASSTSFLTSSLAGLLYVSSSVSSLYEAGAVAALGLTWSLRRMQKKWETARTFWEGEVREEGRKAVRGAEASVAEALDKTGEAKKPGQNSHDGERAKELVERAANALARLK